MSAIISELLDSIDPVEFLKTEKRMVLASQIYDELQRKQLSIKDFAKMMNRDPRTVRKWIRGSGFFDLDLLIDIENKLNIKIFYENLPS